MNAYKKLLKTELKLSFRGMDMLIFAVILPLILLVILGIIYGEKPAFEGATYSMIDQSFGALITISICAGGVMGLPIVISDYRSKQILKRFKVTPINPITILLVELTVYFIYALISFITLLLLGNLLFGFKIQGTLLKVLFWWSMVLVSMFSIGLMVGGLAKNAKRAGVIASALYFPMLIFSGATLPYEVMPHTLQKIVDILPLTQGIKILKNVVLGLEISDVFIPVIIMVSITLICLGVAIRFFKWE